MQENSRKMTNSLLDSDHFSHRMRAAVSTCWEIFARKVGSGLLAINKEASMQLQYAYLLQQIIPLITHGDGEYYEVELETGARVQGKTREIDLLFRGCCGDERYSIAVEMKCYKTLASSGKPRGATDIFMKDVYFDLWLLEQYMAEKVANEGIALVMTDMKRLVYPSTKKAKCWDYDISHGAKVKPSVFDTPIGGKPVNFELGLNYELDWHEHGDFWFLEAQGEESSS